MKISREKIINPFLKKIEEMSSQDLSSCYQCGKCSAGCPMTEDMGLLPHKIIRFLHLGENEEALQSKTIWLCASCHTCASRCPQSFDLSKMMESLRHYHLRRGDLILKAEMVQKDLLKRAPQQALVGAFRKYSN